MGRGSGAGAKTWPKMKMKRGDGVIDRLIPPHAPVTRLIGVAKTEAGRGEAGGRGEASATRQRPASQVGALPGVCACRRPLPFKASLRSFILKEELEMNPARVFFLFFLIECIIFSLSSRLIL